MEVNRTCPLTLQPRGDRERDKHTLSGAACPVSPSDGGITHKQSGETLTTSSVTGVRCVCAGLGVTLREIEFIEDMVDNIFLFAPDIPIVCRQTDAHTKYQFFLQRLIFTLNNMN